MANRPKLTIEDQVAYMKNKGITFDHCSEKDAVRFLQESTYFFKVKLVDCLEKCLIYGHIRRFAD